MIEPTTPTIISVSPLSLLVALVGVQAGPYVLLLFGALVGGWMALSETKLNTTMMAVRFLISRLALAVLFTFPLAWLAEVYIPNVPAEIILIVASFLIGWKWHWITTEAVSRLKSNFTRGAA